MRVCVASGGRDDHRKLVPSSKRLELQFACVTRYRRAGSEFMVVKTGRHQESFVEGHVHAK